MSAARFADDVAAQHRRLDLSAWEGVYVVGDVHGCRPALDRLLDDLSVGPDDLVVFVGDLVRKGPDNHGVVDLVRSSPNMVSVRGNNEEKLLRGEKEAPDLTDADLGWLASLPLVVSWEDHLVVHGGIDPRKPLSAHDGDDIQNVNTLAPDGGRPYWWERYEGPDRVFFGHKPLARPVVREHAVGLDTGCVYGGALTAYDYREDRFVSTQPTRTHEHRPAHKFVTPKAAAPASD